MATRRPYLGTPEPFDAANDNWNNNVKQFRHFFLANRVTEDTQKLHFFLTLIGVARFKLLLNLIAPQEPGDLNYNQVVEQLTSHFKPKKLKIAECFCFYKWNQLK